jgi:cytochrome c biogenesis protein CcdA
LPDDLALPDEAGETDIGEAASTPEPSPSEPQSDVIDLPVFGELRVSDLGLPLFTFLVGLVDGFNPCAMWILVFLLSVLVNVKDRRKILLIAGTFVLVSGIAYFAFMAAWLNLFMLIGIARKTQVILGVLAMLIGIINVKDFFAFKKGISLSIPESSKPGLYKRVREIVSAKYLTAALAGVIVLAVIVNMVELLCTAGLPALYTQILTMQELPLWKNYSYLALYIAAYMLDDTILLTVVVATLSHRRLQEREGRWLKLISGLVILMLGLVMIFKPEWLQLGH